jgi:hypothetical protein
VELRGRRGIDNVLESNDLLVFDKGSKGSRIRKRDCECLFDSEHAKDLKGEVIQR